MGNDQHVIEIRRVRVGRDVINVINPQGVVREISSPDICIPASTWTPPASVIRIDTRPRVRSTDFPPPFSPASCYPRLPRSRFPRDSLFLSRDTRARHKATRTARSISKGSREDFVSHEVTLFTRALEALDLTSSPVAPFRREFRRDNDPVTISFSFCDRSEFCTRDEAA